MRISAAEQPTALDPSADWNLLASAKTAQGKEAAQKAASLIAMLRPKAFSLAYRLLQDRGLAEDVLQESFIRLWKSSAINTGQARLATYFHRIVFNEAMRTIERFKPEQSLDLDAINGLIESQQRRDEDDVSFTNPSSSASPAEMEAAIAQLPHRQRAALLLWAYEDMSIKEIAIELKLQENAAHQLLFRAKHALRKQLEGQS